MMKHRTGQFLAISTAAFMSAEVGATGGTDAPTAAAKKKEPEVEVVVMGDGRKVDFTGKSRIQKESFLTAEGKVQVRLDFRNGETRLFTVPDALLLKFAAHGALQKLGDEAAGVKDMDDAVLAIDNLVDRLYEGEWNIQSDKSGLAGASILLKAMVEVTGKTVDEIKTFLKSKSAAEKLALRQNARIKPTVDRLEAEKAARAKTKGDKIDSDALLGDFLGTTGATATESEAATA